MTKFLDDLEKQWFSHGVKFARTSKRLKWVKTLRSATCAICSHREVETKIDQSFPLWGVLPTMTDSRGKFPEICPEHSKELPHNAALPRFAECQCGVRQREKIYGIGWPGWSVAVLNPLSKLMCPNCFAKLVGRLDPSFVRGTWTDLAYTPGQFLTDTIMNQNQANFEALIQGHAGAPSTDIKMRVHRSANQSIPHNVLTVVQFNAEDYDPGSHFNTTTYRFTAPITGYYQLTAALLWANNGVINYRMLVLVELNNTAVYLQQCSVQRTVDDYYNSNLSDAIHLTAGDFLEVIAWQNSGIACNVHSAADATFFSVQFLSI